MNPNNSSLAGLVSVILPCYNVEPYIERCLKAIIQNSYRHLEIICVVDGATDNTLGVIECINDERIRIITQDNRGLCAARNVGIEAANGEYICFIDPDDWVHRDYFGTLVRTQQETGACIVCCDFIPVAKESIDDTPIGNIQTVTGKFKDLWQHYSFRTFAWGKLFKREIIGDNRFENGMRIAEDKFFNVNLLMHIPDNPAAIIKENLYYYYQRSNSISHICDTMTINYNEYFHRLYNCWHNCTRKDIKPIIAKEFLKLALSIRYAHMFSNKKIWDECNKCMNVVVKDYWKHPVSIKNRIILTAFVNIPLYYRLYRISLDPTLRDWERKQKSIKQ